MNTILKKKLSWMTALFAAAMLTLTFPAAASRQMTTRRAAWHGFGIFKVRFLSSRPANRIGSRL